MRVISVVPLIVPFGESVSPSAAQLHPIPDLLDTLEKQARLRAEEAVARGLHILSKEGFQAIETDQPVGDARQVTLD